MGCYNETCMLSGLPILEGDACTAVFLIQSTDHQTGCYPCEAWMPVLVINGTYDGYGGICPEENRDAEKLLGCLAAQIDGNPLSPDNDCTTVKDLPYSKTMDVRRVFLRKDVQNLAMENIKANHNIPAISEMHKELQNTARTFAALFKKPVSLQTPDEIKEEGRCSSHILEILNHVFDHCTNVRAKNMILRMIGTWPDAMSDMVRQITELNLLLSALRRAWHIPSGAGSQESAEPAQKLFLQFYKNALDDMENKMTD